MVSFKKFWNLLAGLIFVIGVFLPGISGAEQTAEGLATELAQVSPDAVTTSQTTTTATAPSEEPVSLTTALPIEAADLGVPKPSFWQYFKRKFLRLFSFSPIRRLRFDNELAKLTLLKARQASNLGNTDRALKLLADYETQVQETADQIGSLVQDFRGTNLQANELLAQIEQDLVLEASLLDQLGEVKTAQLQKKPFLIKLNTLKHLVDFLAKENLPPEKLAQKITRLSQKLANRETKIEKKIGKRLSLLDNLEEADEKSLLGEGLEGAEDQVVKEVTQAQNQTSLGQIVREIEGSTRKHIIVLQKVLEQVPEAARPAIQAVIDKELEKIAERLKTDPNFLNKVFKPTRFWDTRLKLLERLRTRFGEKLGEQTLEAIEKKEGKEEVKEEEAEEPKTQSITIEVKSGRLSPARIDVKKDTKLTIRFQNQDRVERALTFSNGATTGPLPPRGVTEIVLTIIAPLEFSVEGVGKGQIILK